VQFGGGAQDVQPSNELSSVFFNCYVTADSSTFTVVVRRCDIEGLFGQDNIQVDVRSFPSEFATTIVDLTPGVDVSLVNTTSRATIDDYSFTLPSFAFDDLLLAKLYLFVTTAEFPSGAAAGRIGQGLGLVFQFLSCFPVTETLVLSGSGSFSTNIDCSPGSLLTGCNCNVSDNACGGTEHQTCVNLGTGSGGCGLLVVGSGCSGSADVTANCCSLIESP
jgi:hypothetical protein